MAELVVVDLPGRSLVVERRMPMRSDPWPPGLAGPLPCPVCAKPWRPWAGSLLPCHAGCLFDDRDRRRIVETAMTPIRIEDLASKLGVTTAVIRHFTRNQNSKGSRTI